MTTFIISFIIIVFASLVQGITGFGFSLLSVPLLTFVLPLEVIVPVLVIYSLVLNIAVFSRVKGHVNKIQIILLVAFGIVSIPIGIYGLKSVEDTYIKLLVGGVIIISALAMQFNFKIHFKNQKLAYALTGLFSGILNGSSSLSGPPVILLLSNEGADKDNFRKTLATYFMALNIFSIPMFLASGMITKTVLKHTITLLPALAIGVFIGLAVGDKIPDKVFRKVTLVMIFVMGLLTVASAF